MNRIIGQRTGFTLIELMVVVAIIGILSALALPNFMKFLAKTKQAEARINLGEVYVCQQSYFGENQTYAGGSNAFNLIGFNPKSPGLMRYIFVLDDSEIIGAKALNSPPTGIPSTSTGFTCIAAGNIDADEFIDTWGINNSRELRNQVPTSGGWGADGNDVQN